MVLNCSVNHTWCIHSYKLPLPVKNYFRLSVNEVSSHGAGVAGSRVCQPVTHKKSWPQDELYCHGT